MHADRLDATQGGTQSVAKNIAQQRGLMIGFIEAIVDVVYEGMAPKLLAAFRNAGVADLSGGINNEQRDIITTTANKLNTKNTRSSAGIAGNTMYHYNKLAGNTRVITATGNDEYGRQYRCEALRDGIEIVPRGTIDGATTNVVYVTKNESNDRVMAFCGGTCNEHLKSELLTDEHMRGASFLLLESFIFFNPEKDAITKRMSEQAKKDDIPLVLLAGSAEILTKNFISSSVKNILSSDTPVIFFANKEECDALGGEKVVQTLLQTKSNRSQALAVITDAGNPVKIITPSGVQTVNVGEKLGKDGIINTLGAGDAFAAGFLFGLHKGLTIERAVLLGHNLGAKVVQQEGARLADPKAALPQEFAQLCETHLTL